MPPTPTTPSASDDLITILASWGKVGITLALAAIPFAAFIADRFAQMRYKGKIDNLEGEVARLTTAIKDTTDSAAKIYAELNDKYEALLRSGAMIHAELQPIVTVAGEIAMRVDANAYGVLVPAPTSIAGDKPSHLVFLYASGPQAVELRWVNPPIGEESLAGKVYQSGQTTIASPSEFAKSVDKITDYKTNEILAVCLRDGTGPVGVAQFLNKRNDQQFTPKDKELAEDHCSALTPLVANFTKIHGDS